MTGFFITHAGAGRMRQNLTGTRPRKHAQKRALSQQIRLTNVILISYFVLLTLDFLVFYCYYKSINEIGIRVTAPIT